MYRPPDPNWFDSTTLPDHPLLRTAAARDAMRAGIPPAPGPVLAPLAIREGPLGARKSYWMLKEISQSDERILFLVPDHKLATQHIAVLQGMGVTGGVAHYYSQGYEIDGEPVCIRAKHLPGLEALDMDGRELCTGCPKFDTCFLRKGWSGEALEARIVFAPVSVLPFNLLGHEDADRRAMGAALGFDRMIIDECPVKALLNAQLFRPDLPLRALEPDINSESRNAETALDLMSALSAARVTLDRLPRYSDIERLREAVHRTARVLRTQRAAAEAGRLDDQLAYADAAFEKHPRLRHRVAALDMLDRLLLAMQAAGPDGQLPGIKPLDLVYDEDTGNLRKPRPGDKLGEALRGVEMGRLYHPAPHRADLPTTLLTSTPAALDVYRRIWWEVVSDNAPWEHGEGTEYVLVTGVPSTYAKTWGKGAEPLLQPSGEKLVRFILDLAERESLTPSPQGYLLTTKTMAQLFAPYMPDSFRSVHFAAVLGKNNMRHRDHYVSFGAQSPWPADLQTQAETLAGEPIDVPRGAWWQTKRGFIDTVENGKIATTFLTWSGHWALEALRAMTMDTPVIQGDRSRALDKPGDTWVGARPAGHRSTVWLINPPGPVPFRVARHMTLDSVERHWHRDLRRLGVMLRPGVAQGRNDLLAALGLFPDAKSAANKLARLAARGDRFDDRAADHGFPFTRDGSIRLPPRPGAKRGRPAVPVVFSAPDRECARDIAISLPLPKGTRIHVNGFTEDFEL